MYHCPNCGYAFCVFDRRVCIGACAPTRSIACSRCGTEVINQHYLEWQREQRELNPDDYLTFEAVP